MNQQLIQILLPLYNEEKEVFPEAVFTRIRGQLTEQFGGITTYSRAPATGLWKEKEDKTVKDAIIIYEVIAKTLDQDWWRNYKEHLEKIFRQDEILIRTWAIQVL
ncbi:MAG: hypothetical protein JWQ14_2724 [Adhaeribacter sp.]|jgi:hypothetical protein|nr:hypothetical protein [Adhaeribacter sp.]